jgi:murein DD-endopeptidase MepM/ murein hydrolase activator NlpD
MNKIDIWPFGQSRRITSVIGERTYLLDGKYVTDFHKGWDTATPVGNQVVLPEGGLLKSGRATNYGLYVVLEGEFYRWQFWHLDRIKKAGGTVEDRDVVCFTGNSGASTAPHCHMQISLRGEKGFVDPHEVFTDRVLATLTFPEDSKHDHISNIVRMMDKLGDKLTDVKSDFDTIRELLSKERG